MAIRSWCSGIRPALPLQPQILPTSSRFLRPCSSQRSWRLLPCCYSCSHEVPSLNHGLGLKQWMSLLMLGYSLHLKTITFFCCQNPHLENLLRSWWQRTNLLTKATRTQSLRKSNSVILEVVPPSGAWDPFFPDQCFNCSLGLDHPAKLQPAIW